MAFRFHVINNLNEFDSSSNLYQTYSATEFRFSKYARLKLVGETETATIDVGASYFQWLCVKNASSNVTEQTKWMLNRI